MFKITISTENAAFEGPAATAELADIMRTLADEIEGREVPDSGSVFDSNGNRVGRWEVS